jgi:hypothetical protein
MPDPPAPLYLDEDVSVLVATILQARGLDAVTTRDVGKLSRTDAEQLATRIGYPLGVPHWQRLLLASMLASEQAGRLGSEQASKLVGSKVGRRASWRAGRAEKSNTSARSNVQGPKRKRGGDDGRDQEI